MRGRVLAAVAAIGLLVMTGGATAQVGAARTATFDQMGATGAPAIRGFVVGLRGQCGGASPRAAREAIQAADVNNDGQIDFLVSMQGVTCSGRPLPTPVCGPQGCGYTLFLSGAGDYVRADFTARSALMMRSGGGWIVSADGQTFGGDSQTMAAPVEAVTGGPLSAPGGDPFSYTSLEELRRLPSQTINAALDMAQDECGSDRLGFPREALQTADVNGDGRPDYLIEMAASTCGGISQERAWCGSRGCSFDLYVSRGRDYEQFSYLAGAASIVRRGQGLAVDMDGVSGPWTVAWDGATMVQVEADGSIAPAGGGDEAAVRAVVSSIYDVYVAGIGSGVPFPEDVETPELERAVYAAADPEIGGLGFDYYCACQDYDRVTYVITGVSVTGDRATAAVDFRSYGQLTQMELRLRRSGGRWRVDDVIDPNGSLRDQLGQY